MELFIPLVASIIRRWFGTTSVYCPLPLKSIPPFYTSIGHYSHHWVTAVYLSLLLGWAKALAGCSVD
ncbi:hypothetical protein ACFLXO_03780 [Chloroflexota bacterium]